MTQPPRSRALLQGLALPWPGLLVGFAVGVEWFRARADAPRPSGGIDERVEGNEGVTAAISATEGGIGAVELTYAQQARLPVAALTRIVVDGALRDTTKAARELRYLAALTPGRCPAPARQ